MPTFKLVSWNVNGLRSISKKGFFDWLEKEKPDLVALQETKISADKLSEELRAPKGYVSFFSHAQRPGYSGVLLYCKERPKAVTEGLGIAKFDQEGRTLVADYGDFILLNSYFPNGKASEERLNYKLDFYDAFLKYIEKMRKAGKKIIFCGDVNTAHKPIDLARPKDNETISGFLPIERAWLDQVVERQYIDTFRQFNDKPDNYSWWHMVTNARARNVGWRIDYFFASHDLSANLVNATIEPHIMGSDHCPVTLSIRI
jgi:exodeoxyribonuclease III